MNNFIRIVLGIMFLSCGREASFTVTGDVEGLDDVMEMCIRDRLWYYYKRKSYMDFSSYMTNVDFFTFDRPDVEESNAGRE